MTTNTSLRDLNPSQLRAVEHRAGHLLIVAGPGTGKTRTLTHRIAETLKSMPAQENVLAITFTHKAAFEMRARLARLLPTTRQVFVGTFHQFCLSLLRDNCALAGLAPDFRVAPEDEVEALSRTAWPEISSRQRKIKLEEISRWKSSAFETPVPADVDDLNTVLRKNKVLDFDDLLLETLQMLNRHEDLLVKVREIYRNIFVDEYQDLNSVQYALLKVLVGPGNRLTAIGDPHQAIYGFRGADLKFFLSFEKDFPGAAVLSLSENYRSGQNILNASEQVMAAHRKISVPKLTAEIYARGRLSVLETPTDKAEAETIVHQIEKLVGGTSMFSKDSGRVEGHEEVSHSFGDIAVLYRLHSQCRLLEKAFDRSGIPYKIYGNKTAGQSEDFLDHFYFPQNDDDAEQGEKVALMTLHAAKGLEFPVVFIAGCEQNLLPLCLEGMAVDLDEERRLFYVGMTRAKERLVLLRARRRMLYGKTYQNPASPFLADIEEGLKEYERSGRFKPREQERQMKLF